MILVVADTSPVHYLILVDAIQVLPALYDRIIVPAAVISELTHPNAPDAIRKWAMALPHWVEVKSLADVKLANLLGPGEAEAIALAEEMKADLILLDEIEGRELALARGLRISGTIGTLEQASERGLIRLPEALERLLQTNFRIDANLIRQALERDAARQRRP